jgi:hypothetical protein
MSRLRVNFLIATSLISFGLEMGVARRAHAGCQPQTEIVEYYQFTDAAGFHDMAGHYAPNPNCPVDFYSTTKEDDYLVGRVMPTFHMITQGITTVLSRFSIPSAEIFLPSTAICTTSLSSLKRRLTTSLLSALMDTMI